MKEEAQACDLSHENVRAVILKEAKKLFLTQGFEKTTMADIALRSNIPCIVCTHHFPGTDELLEELWSKNN